MTKAPAPAGARSASPFTHVVSDFLGVPRAKLADPSVVSGLVIAAASAAGMSAAGAPVVRALPECVVAGLLMIDGGSMVAHAFPERELLLLDILASAQHDAQKAVDVFARRLEPREVRSEARSRG